MCTISSGTNMQSTTASGSRSLQNGYRGRVRTGCLTCRSRKVRCDEAKPICDNCTRVKRRCVYKPKKSQQQQQQLTAHDSDSSPLDISVQVSDATRQLDNSSISHTFPSPLFEERDYLVAEANRSDGTTDFPWEDVQDSFLSPDNAIVAVTAQLENVRRRQNGISFTTEENEFEAASPSTLISRDINLTTTMDILTAREVPLQPSFSFFVEEVECTNITPFDRVNWQRMKNEVVELGKSNSAVASAILAVSALYKAQIYNLPLSKAVSLYHSSVTAYGKLLDGKSQNFDVVITATLLLCLFEFVHYEMTPLLKDTQKEKGLIKSFEASSERGYPHSELSCRVISWLRLLYTTTIRGGGKGIITESIYSLLPLYSMGNSNLKPLSNQYSDTSSHLYEMLSSPIIEFYFQVQMISSDIAKLTHYHRPRTTGTDQEDVIQRIGRLKSRLHTLWDNRSPTQLQTPEDLRSNLASKIANPLISLIGVCTAAYHGEFIEIDRVLGDPISESTDSKQAMLGIREIIEGDYNAYDDHGKLNPGYLRPLFLYGIECMNRDENQWVVEKLRDIKNPICRSDFFAAFAEALSDAQLRKERRVTSKYFCIWYFGVPPPFM